MTPKQAAENLGKPANFRGHEYTLTALIKRHTPKGTIWQVELTKNNSVVICKAEEIEEE